MARQLMVQPHFLHFTTQAVGSPRLTPVMPPIIGEQKEKVIPSPEAPISDCPGHAGVARYRFWEKTALLLSNGAER
jgi:hypothetical protein